MGSKIGRRTATALGLVCAVAAFTVVAHAQTYPSRPIRIIVPYPPGNLADVTARTLSEPLSKRLGQPIVIDNKPGATGVIGVDAAVHALPDGHTLLLNSISLVIGPAILKQVPYDVATDLAPVALIGQTSMMLVANPEFPARDLAATVALLKDNPGKYSYAHFGVGSLSQISMEAFKRAAGLDIVGVPYRGAAQALTDVLAGQLPLMFDAMTSAYGHVRAGKTRAIAISAGHRSSFAPEVPTPTSKPGARCSRPRRLRPRSSRRFMPPRWKRCGIPTSASEPPRRPWRSTRHDRPTRSAGSCAPS